MKQRERILVAMSGGIDSSAVCLLLREQGYEPVGMTMRVFDLPRQLAGSENGQPDFVNKARELADRLGMEHYVADVREDFRTGVVRYFLDEYEAGRTPNPCVRCNRDFKFRLMTEWADRLGCERMATGHYVRKERGADGNDYLLMGSDVRKDQSYFLWRVPQPTLRRCVFPLGETDKPQVRAYLAAQGFGLKAREKESMEVCFVEGDYRDFLRAERPELAARVAGGRFVNRLGQTLGQHLGVPFYTVGQRKGLGIALGAPAYVVRLNAEKNTVVLGTKNDLEATAFIARDEQLPDSGAFFASERLGVRIRYHSRPVPCRAERLPDGRLLVRTAEAVSAVTPGQSAVFYEGARLVGGAFIDSQKGIGEWL